MSAYKYPTLKSLLSAFKTVHTDNYDYSKVKVGPVGSRIKVKCHAHGEWSTTIRHHVSGMRCRKCADHDLRLTTKEFIAQARAIHKGEYTYPRTEYVTRKEDVCITCRKHGDFYQRPQNHLIGSGCPTCYGTSLLPKEDWLKEARKVHGSRFRYDLSEYPNVLITCRRHNLRIKQYRGLHLAAEHPCPKCLKAHRLEVNGTAFVQKAKLRHGNTYDYSKVKYVNSQTDVTVVCPTHGDFKTNPANHVRKSGCPHCKVQSANRYLRKQVRIQGCSFSVQGYEPQALKWLTKVHGVRARDIVCGSGVPLIPYKVKGVHRTHYPDFYVPSTNTLYEVKSTWTLLAQNKEWSTILAKRSHAKAMGYKYVILLMTQDGVRLKLPKQWWTQSPSEINSFLRKRYGVKRHV